MRRYKFRRGDCLDLLKDMPDNTIDSVITDPPYALNFMGRDWDRGLPSKEVWAEVLRVTKPGGVMLAFGGTRTFHRLACNVEDGGWEIKDCISWMYGQGFPKSMNIAKAIDKANRGCPQGGPDPESPNAGKYKSGCTADSPLGRHHGAGPGQYMKEQGIKDERELCPEAKRWDGWGTALKPSWEPVLFCMKPTDGTYADNANKWKVAGINIDETRIGYQSDADMASATPQGVCRSKPAGSLGAEPVVGRDLTRRQFERPELKGRFPANVVLSHHPQCELRGEKKVKAITGGGGNKTPGLHGIYGKFDGHNYEGKLGYYDAEGMETVEDWHCHDDCPIKILDEQTSGLKGGTYIGRNRDPKEVANKIYGKFNKDTNDVGYGDKGGASRFFYCAKSSRKERNDGCDHLFWEKDGKAFRLIDEETWEALPQESRAKGNIHTTVKPIRLMEYLCKLLKMPEPTTVLDPFAGSGSTGVAALGVGLNFLGFDNDPVASVIAEARLRNVCTD